MTARSRRQLLRGAATAAAEAFALHPMSPHAGVLR
jgi:hypothetical protein